MPLCQPSSLPITSSCSMGMGEMYVIVASIVFELAAETDSSCALSGELGMFLIAFNLYDTSRCGIALIKSYCCPPVGDQRTCARIQASKTP